MTLRAFLWLASGLLLCLGTTACCTKTVFGSERNIDQALRYLEQHGRLDRGAMPRPAVSIINEQTDTLGFKHQRLQQMSGTVPIWGRELIIHYDRAGVLYRIDGELARIDHWNMPAPRLTTTEALAHASMVKSGWTASQAELYVYVDGEDTPHLTYYITLTRDLLREFVFIDALDGHLVAELPGTMSDTSSLR